MAASVERIAAFGQKIAVSADAALTARLALAGLSADYFTALAAAGAKVRDTARAADVLRNVKKLSQPEVDYLELLGHIIAAFESAHGLDPAVPRLGRSPPGECWAPTARRRRPRPPRQPRCPLSSRESARGGRGAR